MLTRILENPDVTAEFGKQLSSLLSPPFLVILKGELGAGKTTLVRGFLQGLGVTDSIKSPTYSLVETYPFLEGFVVHFDLYRIVDPKELEIIGIQEYFDEKAIVFVEWAEKGEGYIPAADLIIELTVIPEGREMHLKFLTEKGRTVMNSLQRNA